MPQPEITITISGPAKSGKSAHIAVIASALAGKGIIVTFNDPETMPPKHLWGKGLGEISQILIDCNPAVSIKEETPLPKPANADSIHDAQRRAAREQYYSDKGVEPQTAGIVDPAVATGWSDVLAASKVISLKRIADALTAAPFLIDEGKLEGALPSSFMRAFMQDGPRPIGFTKTTPSTPGHSGTSQEQQNALARQFQTAIDGSWPLSDRTGEPFVQFLANVVVNMGWTPCR